jgi:hypothetical protein
MAKKSDKSWQFKVSLVLVVVVALLIGGYFYQSAVEIRGARPVEVAVERIEERLSKNVGHPRSEENAAPSGAVDSIYHNPVGLRL